MSVRRCLAVLALTLGGFAGPAHAAAPANDQFENPQTLTTDVTATGSSAEASHQLGEPEHSAFKFNTRTVWFSWTAPASGLARIHSCGSDFDTVLAVYGGSSLSGLYATRRANNEDACGDWFSNGDPDANRRASIVHLRVQAGATYRIVLDGPASYSSGKYRIKAEMLGDPGPPPANDDVDAAAALSGQEVTTTGTTLGATSGWNDWPGQAGQAVWWKWTSPADGSLVVDTCGSNFNTYLGVVRRRDGEWAGGIDSGSDCTAGGRVELQVATGQEYFIAVGGEHAESGAVRLHLKVTPDTTPPVTSVTAGPSGTWGRRLATYEFWAFDDQSGQVTSECSWDGGDWQFCGSPDTRTGLADGDHVFRVRSRDAHGNVESPVERRFTVDIPAAANDDFAAAPSLSPGVVLTTNNGRATAESGERGHSSWSWSNGGPAHHSVWYRFTAADDRVATLDWCASGVDAVMAIYTGDRVNALTRIGSRDEGCSDDFYVEAGTTYRIALDGASSDPSYGTGPLSIELSYDGPPLPETTITSGPPAVQRDAGDAIVSFSSDSAEATFTCQLDSGPEAPCASPVRYAVPFDFGQHVVRVWATDSAGVRDGTPAIRRWQIDPRPTISGTTRAGRDLYPSYGPVLEWLRCDEAGADCVRVGADVGSYDPYRLTADDTGHRMRIRVADRSRTGATVLSRATPVIGPPVATASPVVSGITRAGATLTTTNGTWSPVATSYAYAWLRCDETGGSCLPVGVNARTYTLSAEDTGRRIRVRVTASNSGGSGVRTSAATPVIGRPVVSTPPVVSGTAQAGQLLTTSTGTWSPAPTSYAYAWLRCDAAGRACEPIASAAGRSYRATAADAGHQLRARVTATNPGGSGTSVTAPTAVVAG